MSGNICRAASNQRVRALLAGEDGLLEFEGLGYRVLQTVSCIIIPTLETALFLDLCFDFYIKRVRET